MAVDVTEAEAANELMRLAKQIAKHELESVDTGPRH